MKKRILSLTMALVLMATLTGCVTNEESDPSSKRDDKSISESSDKSTKPDKSNKNDEPDNESSDVYSTDKSSAESSTLSDDELSSSSESSDVVSEPENDNTSSLDMVSKYFETDNGRILMKLKNQSRDMRDEWLNEAYAAHPEINYISGYKDPAVLKERQYDALPINVTIDDLAATNLLAYMNLIDGYIKYYKKDFEINPTDVEIRNLCPGLTENQYSIFYCMFGELGCSMYEQTADEILNDYQIDVSTLDDYSVAINMANIYGEEKPDTNTDVLRIGMFTAKNENDAIEIMDKLLACKDASLLNDDERNNAWVIVRKANIVYFAQLFDKAFNITNIYEPKTNYDRRWNYRIVFSHLAHIINIDENTGVAYSTAKFLADKYLEGVELIGYDEAVSEASLW